MLGERDIIAFVATAQPARALRFYGETLGLRLLADTPPALVFDVNGVMLRIANLLSLTEFSRAGGAT